MPTGHRVREEMRRRIFKKVRSSTLSLWLGEEIFEDEIQLFPLDKK